MENQKVIETRDLMEAFRLHLSGNEKQAQAIYRDILGFDVNHPDFLYILGNLAHCIAEYETAVILMNQAIQYTPGRSQYYRRRTRPVAKYIDGTDDRLTNRI